MAAVVQNESTRRVERLGVLETIKESYSLGPSNLHSIRHQIVEARESDIVEIRLGPTPWWTTRLHLASALACDFTQIKQFLFVDDKSQFVTMASPSEIRRVLSRRYPGLERAYLESQDHAAVWRPGAMP